VDLSANNHVVAELQPVMVAHEGRVDDHPPPGALSMSFALAHPGRVRALMRTTSRDGYLNRLLVLMRYDVRAPDLNLLELLMAWRPDFAKG